MLKRMLHSAQTVLTKPVTLTGTEIQATETVNAKFDDFQMSGKTTQDGEPTPDNPIEIVNAGKYNEETGRYEVGLKVSGKNLCDLQIGKTFDIATGEIREQVNYAMCIIELKEQTDVTISVPSGEEHGWYLSYIYHNNVWSNMYSKIYPGKSATITLSEGVSMLSGNAINAAEVALPEFKPIKLQIEEGDTATAYEAYHAKEVTLTSPVPITKWDKLVKRDGVWGWSIYGKEYKMTADEVKLNANNASANKVRLYIFNVNANRYSECKCNIFACSNNGGSINIAGYHYNGNFAIYISNTILSQYGYEYDETLDKNTLTKRATDAYRELIRAAGGIQIVVDMQEEQAFHPLPDEEQALMNSLQSYYPTTIIRNTEDLEMEVTMKSLNILGGGV